MDMPTVPNVAQNSPKIKSKNLTTQKSPLKSQVVTTPKRIEKQKQCLFDLAKDVAIVAKRNSLPKNKTKARLNLEKMVYDNDRKKLMNRKMNILMSTSQSPSNINIKKKKSKLKNLLTKTLNLKPSKSSKANIRDEQLKFLIKQNEAFQKHIKLLTSGNTQLDGTELPNLDGTKLPNLNFTSICSDEDDDDLRLCLEGIGSEKK